LHSEENLTAFCVCCVRGLFEKDKLVFSFMLCVEVLKLSDQVSLLIIDVINSRGKNEKVNYALLF